MVCDWIQIIFNHNPWTIRYNTISIFTQLSILCLQDTHFITAQETFIESQWGYKCYLNSYMSIRGLCVFFLTVIFSLKNVWEKNYSGSNLFALDLPLRDTRLPL